MSALRRRGLLGGVAALAPATGLAAVLPPPALANRDHPDTDLLALVQQFHVLHRRAYAMPCETKQEWDDLDRVMDERWDVARALEDMCPSSAEGCMAKASVALVLAEENHGGDSADDFVVSALRDLVRLSGGAA